MHTEHLITHRNNKINTVTHTTTQVGNRSIIAQTFNCHVANPPLLNNKKDPPTDDPKFQQLLWG